MEMPPSASYVSAAKERNVYGVFRKGLIAFSAIPIHRCLRIALRNSLIQNEPWLQSGLATCRKRFVALQGRRMAVRDARMSDEDSGDDFTQICR